jgi:23S rRNA (uracil1939-C5)-methyltransferase
VTLAAGSEHEVRFTDLLANGQGVARAAGVVVFVWGPLPEERARIRIVEVKKSYAVGDLIEILETSPERTTPFCPVFGTCGGCQVQHLAYDAQLRWKSRVVHDALTRIGGFESIEVEPTVGMPSPRSYRNKMALVVRRQDSHAQFGFYQMRSHDFVPIAGCPVVLPQLEDQIAALQHAADDPELAGAFDGVLHAISRAGSATGQSVLTLTTAQPSSSLRAASAALAQRVPGIVGIANSFAPKNANAIMGSRHRDVWGGSTMEERIGALRYRISAASFFQINTEIVARIFDELETLGRPKSVVDLYCGAGTFSIWFAAHGASVTGIEDNPSAIREAQANAALNGVAARTNFVLGRVESAIARGPGRDALEDADVVFLDPPRKGCEPQTLDALVAADVPAVWYLSCNPATLARDLARLRGGGYCLESVRPYDMFPQTGHVETLATMRRRVQPEGGSEMDDARPRS